MPPTGLPNRFLFQEQLHRSVALFPALSNPECSVYSSIWKDFPSIVSNLGKKLGSAILKQITNRLLEHKRESDTLAYLDNNEFGLLLEHVPDEGIVYLLAKRVRKLLADPFNVDHNQGVIYSTDQRVHQY